MTTRYLSRPQLAERIGLKYGSANKYNLPEPDAYIGTLPGWLPETIDAWQASRPGRGRAWPDSSADQDRRDRQ